MKICAYICGDINIIYPAIVVLYSIKKFNNLDLYLYAPRKFFKSEQIQLCDKLNINIIDTEQSFFLQYIENFSSFGRWSQSVFLNYIAPLHLYNSGYNYAIKCDYDILCTNTYDIADILPIDSSIITILHNNLKLCNTTSNKNYNYAVNICKDLSNNNYNIKKSEDITTINAGFIVINLQKYVYNEIHIKFLHLYTNLNNNIKLQGESIEQFILSILQLIVGNFKKLPIGYNFCPAYHYNPGESCFNIHYNIMIKPWTDIIKNKHFITNALQINHNFTSIYFFNKWILTANELNFDNFIYRNKIYTDFEIHQITHLIKIFFINQLKQINLLNKYSRYITNHMHIHNTIIDKAYRYIQFQVSKDNNVHYEILFIDNQSVKIALHFEGDKKNILYV